MLTLHLLSFRRLSPGRKASFHEGWARPHRAEASLYDCGLRVPGEMRKVVGRIGGGLVMPQFDILCRTAAVSVTPAFRWSVNPMKCPSPLAFRRPKGFHLTTAQGSLFASEPNKIRVSVRFLRRADFSCCHPTEICLRPSCSFFWCYRQPAGSGGGL